MEQGRDPEDGKDSKKSEPEDTGGEEGTGRVGGPEDGQGGVEWKESEEKGFAIGDAGEFLVFSCFGEEEKIEECDGGENEQPDEREGEFKIHGGITAEREERIIGKKEDGRQKVNQTKIRLP